MKNKIAFVLTLIIILSCKVAPAKTQTQQIPVFMYHMLTTDSHKTNNLTISQSAFRSQMNYLKTNGYTTITMDQFYTSISKKIILPAKSVLITFDDGYISNYKLAYPILKANKQKATLFMISHEVGRTSDSMNAKQLLEMDANGFRVESHTDWHENLGSLPYAKQLNAIRAAKTSLEKLLGRKVMYLAYPCGSYNTNTIKAAHAAGCNLGLTTNEGFTSRLDNPYRINRIYMGPSDNLKTLKHKLEYGKQLMWHINTYLL
ncbi:polysaccharide deacetylase family protein [Clostridium estertheticum]|uniref:polysaccharide deacetylase family protein n=1 Tax=Clostridium estertheticum TaxID=238834 RepID=UPI001CF16319|nr:polysaccharide deacetylase family protein [Clostridium estertheticum]MCB2341055.1 polysaccharide deacetylase family protein [Clostridium estertheticum]